MIKIERYIDDFSDALPRNRRSPLLSRENASGDPRSSEARTTEDRKKGPAPPKERTTGQPARIHSDTLLSAVCLLAVAVCVSASMRELSYRSSRVHVRTHVYARASRRESARHPVSPSSPRENPGGDTIRMRKFSEKIEFSASSR